MTNKIENIGLGGIQAGLSRAAEAAEKIASSGGDVDVEDALKLQSAKRDVAASSKIVQVADEMSESVLRILDRKV